MQLTRGRQLLATLGPVPAVGGAAATPGGLPAFGEAALLDRRPRTAHARAVTDLKLLVLPVAVRRMHARRARLEGSPAPTQVRGNQVIAPTQVRGNQVIAPMDRNLA